jgi:formate/nitrite transporter FocA (FNT family)
MYLLIGVVRPTSLPLPLETYMAGMLSVMLTGVMVFAYALLAPSPKFTLDYRSFAKAATLPTLIIVPLLYAMMRSFFVTQIFGMVVAMSTDMVLTHDLLQLLVAVWWFFLTGVLLLVIKGHHSTNKVLQQEAVGLTLIMSTTFLFNYPYYLMLGIAGIFLISYSLYKE